MRSAFDIRPFRPRWPKISHRAERFVAPTLPPDAIAWDKNHPDILDEDMLYAHSAILIEADTGEVLYFEQQPPDCYPWDRFTELDD